MVLDHLTVERRHVERDVHEVALAKHTEMARACNLTSCIDGRLFTFSGCRRLVYPDNLNFLEVVDLRLIRRRKRRHRQCGNRRHECEADAAL